MTLSADVPASFTERVQAVDTAARFQVCPFVQSEGNEDLLVCASEILYPFKQSQPTLSFLCSGRANLSPVDIGGLCYTSVTEQQQER